MALMVEHTILLEILCTGSIVILLLLGGDEKPKKAPETSKFIEFISSAARIVENY